MRKSAKVLLIVAAVLLGVGTIAGFVFYRASQRAPRFYTRVLAQDRQSAERGSDEFLQQASAAASDAGRPGRWQTLFTADQINGWLAVDVPQNYPLALPKQVQDPRVELKKGMATIACQYTTGGISSVASLSVDVFASAPNEVAVRFYAARLGSIPVPLGKILEPISRAADEQDVAIVWRQMNGDPVAVVMLPESGGSRKVRLEAIELRDDALLIVGKTTDRKSKIETPTPAEAEPATPVAQSGDAEVPQSAAATNKKIQR